MKEMTTFATIKNMRKYKKETSLNESLRLGGILRCCEQAYLDRDKDLPLGTILQCPYSDSETHRLIRTTDGYWEWYRPHYHGGEK